MDSEQDQHAHRNLEAAEAPLDAANQSLADALRASFSVLKGIMMVLVVLYLFSNVRGIESHEEALVLRLGALRHVVDQAGLVWALPFPIDEIIPLPTRQSNVLMVDSHTFHRNKQDVGKPLSFVSRGFEKGLHPVLDGALLTADQGLVHVRWKITYKFDDIGGFVSRIAGDEIEAAEALLRTYVETIGIQIATEFTAEELIRTRVADVQDEMKRRVNERLEALGSGVHLEVVEMNEPTPPLPVRQAFDFTQRAENLRQRSIRDAEKSRTKILSEAAGVVYRDLIELFEKIDQGGTEDEPLNVLQARMDQILLHEVEGKAGNRIKDAGAYRAVVVSRMMSDVERYRTLLPEYKRNPRVLLNRLWEETLLEILSHSGVTKFYFPPNLREIRINVPLDPEETHQADVERLQQTEFDVSKLRPERLVPIGPEFE